MRKQGIKRKDFGCCPGHDKFPKETYNTRTSLKAKRRTDQIANQRARAWAKIEIINELKVEISDNTEFHEVQLPANASAAIAMALHLYYSDVHDQDSHVITIKKVERRYSPWSAKIYGINNLVR